MKYISDQLRFTQTTKSLDRARCQKNEPYPTILNYENRRIKWVHCSAYEFICSRQLADPLFQSSISREELLQKIGNSYMSYLIAAPSCHWSGATTANSLHASLTVRRHGALFAFLRRWYDEYPIMISNLLDRLYEISGQWDPDELYLDPTYVKPGHSDIRRFDFWAWCANFHLKPYILSRIGRIPKEMTCDEITAILLNPARRGHWDEKSVYSYLRFNENLVQAWLGYAMKGLEIHDGIFQMTEYECLTLGIIIRGLSKPAYVRLAFSCATWKWSVNKTGKPLSVSAVKVLLYTPRLPMADGRKA